MDELRKRFLSSTRFRPPRTRWPTWATGCWSRCAGRSSPPRGWWPPAGAYVNGSDHTETDAVELVAAADAGMYRSKRRGRGW